MRSPTPAALQAALNALCIETIGWPFRVNTSRWPSFLSAFRSSRIRLHRQITFAPSRDRIWWTSLSKPHMLLMSNPVVSSSITRLRVSIM